MTMGKTKFSYPWKESALAVYNKHKDTTPEEKWPNTKLILQRFLHLSNNRERLNEIELKNLLDKLQIEFQSVSYSDQFIKFAKDPDIVVIIISNGDELENLFWLFELNGKVAQPFPQAYRLSDIWHKSIQVYIFDWKLFPLYIPKTLDWDIKSFMPKRTIGHESATDVFDVKPLGTNGCVPLTKEEKKSGESNRSKAPNLGLEEDPFAALVAELSDYGYYPNVASHFMSKLAHDPDFTEIIMDINISKTLKDVGFTARVVEFLEKAIKKFSLRLSLFKWVDSYIGENQFDENTLPQWIRCSGQRKLDDKFETWIETSEFHFLGANAQFNIKCTWVDHELLKSKIDDHQETKSGDFLYHSTSDSSALHILKHGVNKRNTLTPRPLGQGFYVSNDFNSVVKYLSVNLSMIERDAAGVVLVFKWDSERQDKYKDKCLELRRGSKKYEEIVNRNNAYSDKGFANEHPVCKKQALITVGLIVGGKAAQMCVKDDQIMKEFINDCLEEVWLIDSRYIV